MQTHYHSQAQRLWEVLERTAGWIKNYIGVTDARSSVQEAYLKWIFDLLKDRVQDTHSDQELQDMVRDHVKTTYGKFRDRPEAASDLTIVTDPSATRFLDEMERADEIRACLESLPKQVRALLLDVYSMGKQEFSRNALARRMGIKRNTLDQRIHRAIAAIRLRKKDGSFQE